MTKLTALSEKLQSEFKENLQRVEREWHYAFDYSTVQVVDTEREQVVLTGMTTSRHEDDLPEAQQIFIVDGITAIAFEMDKKAAIIAALNEII